MMESFKALHHSLARLRLLVLLSDDNVTLTAAEQQDLYLWKRNLVTLAAEQAIEAEIAAVAEVKAAGEAR